MLLFQRFLKIFLPFSDVSLVTKNSICDYYWYLNLITRAMRGSTVLQGVRDVAREAERAGLFSIERFGKDDTTPKTT